MPPKVRPFSGDWLWVERPRPAATARLLCCPPAGGGAASYQGWDAKLNGQGDGEGGVEVAVINMPGRAARIKEPVPDTVASVVQGFLGSGCVKERLGDGRPLVVFGHSFGSAVAYALAGELQGGVQGLPKPRAVVVSCRPAPAEVYEGTLWHQKTDEELTERLRSLGGTPPEVFQYPELLKMILPAFRGDLRLNERFSGEEAARGRLTGVPLTAVYGEEDQKHIVGGVEGWREAGDDVKIVKSPGAHFYFNQPPGWAVLEDVLRGAFQSS
eukprot:Hpha_TRINITY_DN35842_c0_g1::TRINITY_DN35842_c0_g1_i1::g.84980::m.84980